MFGKTVGVLLAGEAFLFIIAQQAHAVFLRDFDERNTGIVQAGCRYSRQIDGLAAIQFFADRGKALAGVLGTRAVNVSLAEVSFQRLLRGAINECA
jgi:hypothetical protein